jgi:non-ribosomal peptide synthetase component E (peptide arylation enzyme)
LLEREGATKMDTRQIKISELSSSLITRQRGKEAFKKLEEKIKPEDKLIELDLTQVDMISTAFLDEIILGLSHKKGLLEKGCIFIIKSPEVLGKIQKVFSARNLMGLYKWKDNDKIKAIEKLTPPKQENVREIKKASIL